MNTALLKRLGVVVAVLFVIWAALRLLPRRSDSLAGDFRLTRIAADSIDSVTITGADTIRLTRAPSGRWTVNGFPAAAGAVNDFFAGIADTAPAELVSQSAGSFGRLGLDSAAARRLRVVRGDSALLDLFVSDRGADVQSAYVRRPGDSSVYAVTAQLGDFVRRGVDDWRDRAIAAVQPDSVQEIELTRGARRSVLRRRDGAWQLASAGGGRAVAADSSALADLLVRLRAISAAGFPSAAQRDSAFRGRADRRLTARGPEGRVLLALEFDSTAEGFWVRPAGGGREVVARMNDWDVNLLFPSDSALRKK